MSLQFVIDAYNLINHSLFKTDNRSANIQSSLVNFIKFNRLTGSSNNRLLIVFDGYSPPGFNPPDEPNIVCLFSGNLEADEIIKKKIESSHNPKDMVVVSDDKEVQIVSRLLHAKVLTVEKFILRGENKINYGNDNEQDPKLTYSAMHKINEELKKRWLEKS